MGRELWSASQEELDAAVRTVQTQVDSRAANARAEASSARAAAAEAAARAAELTQRAALLNPADSDSARELKIMQESAAKIEFAAIGGVRLTGESALEDTQQKFLGLYTPDFNEKDGPWAQYRHVENTSLKLVRKRTANTWQLRDEKDDLQAYSEASAGCVPTHGWHWRTQDAWVERDMQVEKLSQRDADELLSNLAAQTAARSREMLAAGFDLSGHRKDSFNGFYRPVDVVDGLWPRLMNDRGRHFFYDTTHKRWTLDSEFTSSTTPECYFDGCSFPVDSKTWTYGTSGSSLVLSLRPAVPSPVNILCRVLYKLGLS